MTAYQRFWADSSEDAIHRIIQLWLAMLDIKSTFQLIGISQVWIGIIPSTRTHVSHLDCTPPQNSSTYWLIPNRMDQRACITWTTSRLWLPQHLPPADILTKPLKNWASSWPWNNCRAHQPTGCVNGHCKNQTNKKRR